MWRPRHGCRATHGCAITGLGALLDGTQNAVPGGMSKMSALSLSDRDKTPAPSGYGYYFHPAEPQRRVPCVLGNMLAPRSADDIPPITPEAMASVQAALTLLANLVGDRDHGRFLGCGEAKLEEYRGKAQGILSTAKGLAGILRVAAPPNPVATPTTAIEPPHTATIELRVQLSAEEISTLTTAYEHVRVSMAHPYGWASRDITMGVIDKVLTAARTANHS